MEMYMSVASLILGLAQIPFLMLLFRRARRLGRGQGWCYRDLQRVLRRLAAVESSVTDMKEEQEQLRDRLEEAFDVVAAKLDMLTPEEEYMAAFSQGLENILGYTPEAGWEEA